AGSQTCSICHNGLTDINGTDVSIEQDWASTMMANSARDPLFRAKVASEVIRNPQFKSEIEDKCSRCHTPMANVEAKNSGQPVALLPPGFLSSDHALFDAAMDGVSCTLCHQIENSADFGLPSSFSGEFTVGNNKQIYGPFSQPVAAPMTNFSGYTPVFSAHISSSDSCSSCHNLFTDVVDANSGELTGTQFPEQVTYNEWEQSSFGEEGSSNQKSCQNCHMPETNGVKVSTLGMMLPDRDNFSQHYLVGANAFMLGILNDNKSLLGVKANNFETVIKRTRDLLKSAASLEVLNSSNNAGTLKFTVRIKNHSGHKLPSGYPARRAYLHITITDNSGNTVFESGKMNSNGSIVGVDSDSNKVNHEPHFDTITSNQQVQVYESIMQNTNSEITYTLLNGASYKKDNRLLPAGFNLDTATTDVMPDSETLKDSNFTAATDDVYFQLDVNGTGPFTVNVEFNYQSVAYQYAQDLFTDLGKHNYINTFKSVYDAAKKEKETIAEITAIID
ncbi:MAG: cytochrome c family protein, partial [Gammaproteobacteria bacterium]|nr:cytochrome c family protein [Gammaproteobacteria bacterium]